jgi:predicted PurR-regulated permease PerM
MRWRRQLFLGGTAAIVVAVMIAAHEVMMPFVLAVLIAYVLTPLVAMAEKRKISRPVAILMVYAVVIGSLAGFVRATTPRIAQEFITLRGELPTLAAEAKERWAPAIATRLRALGLVPLESPPPPDAQEPTTSAFVARPQADGSLAIDVGTGVVVTESKRGWIVEPMREHKEEPFDPNRLVSDVVGKTFAYAQNNSLEIARGVRDLLAGVSRLVFVFFITLMLAAYLMMTREHILGFFRELVRPSHRASFDTLLARMDRGLSGVVRGQLLICGINGLLSAIGFAIVGLKYWPVMAIVAMVFSLIPIFGSIISSVPAVAIALTQGLGTASFVFFWILGIHQLEANVFNPKILGDTAKIHPVLVIFSLLVGEHFFHAIGALLAMPVMSMLQTVFLHINEATRKDEPELRMEGPRSLNAPPPSR